MLLSISSLSTIYSIILGNKMSQDENCFVSGFKCFKMFGQYLIHVLKQSANMNTLVRKCTAAVSGIHCFLTWEIFHKR